jgi:hypothetical protein
MAWWKHNVSTNDKLIKQANLAYTISENADWTVQIDFTWLFFYVHETYSLSLWEEE